MFYMHYITVLPHLKESWGQNIMGEKIEWVWFSLDSLDKCSTGTWISQFNIEEIYHSQSEISKENPIELGVSYLRVAKCEIKPVTCY